MAVLHYYRKQARFARKGMRVIFTGKRTFTDVDFGC